MLEVLDNRIARLEETLEDEFRDVQLKFAVQVFSKHSELLVYVLDVNSYDRVRARCYQLSDEMNLERTQPEIWLVAIAWPDPWLNPEYGQKLQARRDEFKRKHGIPVTPS